MRWFFRRRVPDINRVLLVESGSRAISARLLEIMRANYGPQVTIDLVTCFPGLPDGFPPEPEAPDAPGTRVWRTGDYRSAADRRRLLAELGARQYGLVGVICSGEPILFKWKCVLAARLRSKVFLINENADYFWLDYAHSRTLWRLALDRAGLAGPSAGRNLATLASFPFTLLFLLGYAGWVHGRRIVGQAMGPKS